MTATVGFANVADEPGRERPHGVWSEQFGADSHYTILFEPDPGRYNRRRLEALADLALVRCREIAATGALDRFLRGERAPSR